MEVNDVIVSRFPSDLMKSTVVDESLSSFKPMYCSREYQASTRLIQQYEKSTLNISGNFEIFNDWLDLIFLLYWLIMLGSCTFLRQASFKLYV